MIAPGGRIVVVGNGMAGQRLLAELDARGMSRGCLAIGAEPRPAYNRILLSAVLSGERTLDDICLGGRDWYESRGIELVSNDPVTAIDRALKRVTLASGRIEDYGTLVLATGSRPIKLPLPGADLDGVYAFRDVADVEKLRAVSMGAAAVVIGGGLLGLEAASGLAKRGARVTLVHLMPDLMERQLDSDAAALLAREVEARGIALKLGAKTQAIEGKDGKVVSVVLADGECLPADLVVMAVGVVPETALARASGLQVSRGVIVDDFLRTSDPDIAALGECAEHRGQTFGLVGPIWEQARVLAARFAGEDLRYEGSVPATTLKVSGVELFSAGTVREGEGAQPIVLRDPISGVYRKLILRDGRLEGAVLFGDSRHSAWYAEAIARRRDVSAWRDTIAFAAPALAAE
ncbi:MAG: NAD(P)/FAD-dependent oxidoreductase [Tagaea sp.]